MQLDLNKVSFKVGDAEFVANEIDYRDYDKLLSRTVSADVKFEIFLSNLLEVRNVKIGDKEVTVEEFKKAPISVSTFLKVLNTYVSALTLAIVPGAKDKKEIEVSGKNDSSQTDSSGSSINLN